MAFRSGFIAFVGKTNVGKSSIINAIMKEKVSIVSNKAQTTRKNMKSVLTTSDYQMIFVDTPGLHKATTKLSEFMLRSVKKSIADSDLIVMVCEAHKELNSAEINMIRQLEKINVPHLLLINKVDKINKLELLPIIEKYSRYSFQEIIPVSAQKKDNIDRLSEVFLKYLPIGPMYYEQENYILHTEKELAEEIIREKVLSHLNEEIPHGIAVTITSMKNEGKTLVILAEMVGEKQSHKPIMIGKDGEKLKKITAQAKTDIGKLLNQRVNLNIWVKIRDKWRNDEQALKSFGFKDID